MRCASPSRGRLRPAGPSRGGRAAPFPPECSLLALLLFLVAACGGTEEAPSAPRNVLLICVDTLRADHLGHAGYERDTSPAIDALARRGAHFTHAFSTYPQTAPSVASLLTSLAPVAHKKTPAHDVALTSSVATLAETFRRAGYRTAAVATNPHLSPGSGYEQGFEDYVYLTGMRKFSLYEQSRTFPGTRTEIRKGGVHYGRADVTGATALEWLDRTAEEERPFFLYLHYMDVHNPYVSPDPYNEMFVEEEGRDHYCNGVPPAPVRERDLAYMRALYDGQIRYLDDQLRQLLDALETRGLAADTLIVFVSDHGDEFLEHGGLGHGETLYRELVHVPLLVAGPGVVPGVHAEPVSTLDVYPTLCELAGIPVPTHVQGVSLAPLVAGRKRAFRRDIPVLSECANTRLSTDPPPARGSPRQGGAGAALSLVDGEWHLIHRPESGTTQLFRYKEDPREERDLAAAEPEVVARLSALAAAALARCEESGRAIEASRTELDAGARADLEALGYTGGDADEPE